MMKVIRMWPAVGILVAWIVAAGSPAALAQKLAEAPSAVMLAKNIQQQDAEASPVAPHAAARMGDAPPDPSATNTRTVSAGATVASIPEQLTLHDAEQIAIRNNPRIRVAQLLARAQQQVVRQTRSAYLPQLQAGVVAADANSGSRFTYDGLRSTRLLTHAGGGLDLHQLITDFGRYVEPDCIVEVVREGAKCASAGDHAGYCPGDGPGIL